MSGVGFDQPIDLSIRARRISTPIERLVHPRTMLAVGILKGDGLTYLAQRTKERHWNKGERLYHPDRRVDAIHVVVEGSTRVTQEVKRLLVW